MCRSIDLVCEMPEPALEKIIMNILKSIVPAHTLRSRSPFIALDGAALKRGHASSIITRCMLLDILQQLL